MALHAPPTLYAFGKHDSWLPPQSAASQAMSRQVSHSKRALPHAAPAICAKQEPVSFCTACLPSYCAKGAQIAAALLENVQAAHVGPSVVWMSVNCTPDGGAFLKRFFSASMFACVHEVWI